VLEDVKSSKSFRWCDEPLPNLQTREEGDGCDANLKTWAEPQQIVIQRSLSCLQHPVLYLSRIQRISLSRYLYLLFSIIWIEFYPKTALAQFYDLGSDRNLTYSYSFDIWKSNISPLSSMNSGLEAFSRNSTRGSFSALTFRSTELPITWTNGSSRTGLDYCRGDHFISRVKLTCLTTV
jgi:hypothetical protein